MKVNYISLINTLAKHDIPPPEHPDQVYRIDIEGRVHQLDRERGHIDHKECYERTVLTLVAVQYGYKNDRWLEWEFQF